MRPGWPVLRKLWHIETMPFKKFITNLRKWEKLTHAPRFPISTVKPKSYGDKTQMSFVRLRSVHCLLSHVIVEFPNSMYALRTYFGGDFTQCSPKETAAHIGTTFLSIVWPITAFVPFSRTSSRQICHFKLVQSEIVFLSSHNMVGKSQVKNRRQLTATRKEAQCLPEACNAENCHREGRYLR